MKKVLTLSLAALMLGALALPANAQDGKKTEEARKVLVKYTYKAMERHTEKSEKSGDTVVKPQGQDMILETDTRTTNETKVTDILEVNDDGLATSVRISWKDGKETLEVVRMGQPPADPVESETARNGVSILYTWDAEKKEYTSKLEKGDEESAAVKKELGKKDPLLNAFIPGREVKVGESWDVDEQALKDMMGKDEVITPSEITATCKAEEIVKEDGAELLRVSMDITMKADMKNEKLGDPELEVTRTGSYFWNIKESRVVRVEIEDETTFDGTINHPQMGKMDLSFTQTGEETKTDTVGKVEDDDSDEGKKDDDGDDDDGDDDGMK